MWYFILDLWWIHDAFLYLFPAKTQGRQHDLGSSKTSKNVQHNSATPSPEDHVLGRVLHDHLPPWLALHCECSQLEAQTSLGYSDWMLNRCFVLSINNNVNNPSNPPATDTFFWNPELTSKFGITYYQAYLQLKVQQSINFVCFFFTTQTQNYRKCSVQNIGRENRCSYIWHHLKFCDVGPWRTSNFSNFRRAGTLNTFQPKQKLFLKIGSCKTLEMI